jgi:hypothetical protein
LCLAPGTTSMAGEGAQHTRVDWMNGEVSLGQEQCPSFSPVWVQRTQTTPPKFLAGWRADSGWYRTSPGVLAAGPTQTGSQITALRPKPGPREASRPALLQGRRRRCGCVTLQPEGRRPGRLCSGGGRGGRERRAPRPVSLCAPLARVGGGTGAPRGERKWVPARSRAAPGRGPPGEPGAPRLTLSAVRCAQRARRRPRLPQRLAARPLPMG